MQAQQQEMEEANTAVSPHANSGRNAPDEGLKSHAVLRVTPEEVALAAAALEAKRDAEHTWHETSLPIDEAIHYLGLNATPLELAPEVVALREERSKRAAKARAEQLERKFRRRYGVVMFVVSLCVLLVTGWMTWQDEHTPRILPSTMTTLPIQKLAAVPDNVPVHIDVDTLLRLAKGYVTPENVSVDTRSDSQAAPRFDNEWTLVKSKGEILVQGWATVEFALSMSNGSTGSLFSARPGWLSANNLLPMQVPVWRLEGQSYVRYLSDGKVAENAGNSVLMAVNVADTSTVAKDLVEYALRVSNAKFAGDVSKQLLYFEVNVNDSVVHITGSGVTEPLKKRTTETAVSTLKRLNLPYTVSNDLEISNQ
ncbi:MAG: hypothetical protein JWN14_5046 [Chthonomonadales bacterium]|nr:hypothetical protein [Chthonomonadales bacterium]